MIPASGQGLLTYLSSLCPGPSSICLGMEGLPKSTDTAANLRKCELEWAECAEGAQRHTTKSTWGGQTQIEPTHRGAVPFGVCSIVSFRLFSAVSLRVSQLATNGINLKEAAWVAPLQPSLQTLVYSLSGLWLLINNALSGGGGRSSNSDTVAAHPSLKSTKV